MNFEAFKMAKKENNPGFHVPESELKFSFSRSSGKGGQNVNKVETKVLARWNVLQSPSLTNEQKKLIMAKWPNRINEKGELIVAAQEERSQLQNKRRAEQILNELVNSALTVAPERKPTQIPSSAKEARLREKARHSEKKAIRQKKFY
jgi:ribosome-associated protein